MKILHLSIIVIFVAGISSAYANPISIDGTVSQKGCSVIKGNMTQATDMQNTTIQVCNYHSKHFKITQDETCVDIGFGKITDPDTGQGYDFAEACDIPSTCGLTDSWGGPQFWHEDRLPVTIAGNRDYIITFYHAGICPSESYDQQSKKVSIVANGVWTNSNMTLLIPKVLVKNVTSVTVNGKNVIPSVTDYPTHDAVPSCPESCYSVIIPLTASSTSEKIEIGAESVPEFPLAMPVLLVGITSLIIYRRLRFGK